MTAGVPSPAPAGRAGIAWLRRAATAQRRTASEAWCACTRRPRPSTRYAQGLGEGRRFTARRGAWMGVLVPIVVVAQVVDVLVAQGVIHVAVAPGARRVALHALLAFVSLWAVAWAVALRSATQRIDHVLDAHALTLAVGFRHLCRVPLSAIAGVRVIDHRAVRNGQDWLDVHGLQPREVARLQALDPPTLLIALAPGAAGAWWTCDGVARPLRRWIAVHVDDPAALAAAVSAAWPAGAGRPTLDR